tara:strand:+ start:1739 stop:2206 length:468 start_codon:yes stop_codon:yes gene_type:complete
METTLEKRLTKESKWIFEKYKNIAMEYNNENPDYTLHLSTTIKGKKLTFLISPNYPFRAPAMQVNGVDYIQLLSFSFPELQEYLGKINKPCLCCSTLLCSNNWKPGVKLMNVINEYEEIREIIVKCLYKKYTRIVCNHFNIFAEELVENIIKYIN